MVVITLAQPHQECADRVRGDAVQRLHAGGGQEPVVPAQVAPVRRQRVRRQPALDHQVVQIGADGNGDGRAQASTSSSGTNSSSCASATGPYVRGPSQVFSPSERLGSARSASFQPRLASSSAYGMVTLVSACVDVFGTAPGMFATQ